MDIRTELELKKISDNCFIKTYISCDESAYILEINYKSGFFVSEKIFPNNYEGVVDMEETKSLYKNENDVKRYFGLI